MRRNWTPSIVPTDHDQTIYLVVNNFRHLGTAFTETDVEQGRSRNHHQRSDERRIQRPGSRRGVQYREHWAEDVSEIMHARFSGALILPAELPSSIEVFIEMHAGPSRQLSLRLN
jgi:hypothetical protein